MFRKLLKYDMKAVFRVWLIFTLAFAGVTVLGVVSAFSMQVSVDSFVGIVAFLFSLLGSLLYEVGIGAYLVLTVLFIFLRFYRNLFSDEGYLTFSIPAKRSTIYMAKTVNALIWQALSLLVVAGSLTAMVLAGEAAEDSLFFILFSDFDALFEDLTIRNVLDLLILLFDGAIYLWFGVELIQFCITIGSVIAKKGKFMAGLGIYMGINSALTTFLYTLAIILLVFVDESFISVLLRPGILELLLVLLAVIFAALATYLHCSTASRIERKLNLA